MEFFFNNWQDLTLGILIFVKKTATPKTNSYSNKALTKPRNRTNIFGKLVYTEIKLEIKNDFYVNYGSAIQNYLSQ